MQSPISLLNGLMDPVVSAGIPSTGDLNALMGVHIVDTRLCPCKTLILGDSFLLKQMPTQLSHLFENVTLDCMQEYGQAGQYDRVITERVQRFSGTQDRPPLTTTLWRSVAGRREPGA